jgi:hypothetical protein
MVNSDEDLREVEKGLGRDATAPEPAADDGRLADMAPSQPEDVARKILREAFKAFPIPGKK